MVRNGATGSSPPVMPADGPDAALYERAIQRAIEVVNADGGGIATLDDSRKAMIVRVRQVHPRVQATLLRASRSRPLHPSHSIHPAPAVGAPIDEAATTQLSTQLWRVYHRGERLIGTVWHAGEGLILTGDEVRALPAAQNAPEDPPAAWYMAVPIFAPVNEQDAVLREPPVIGVLYVYLNDPQWRFSQSQLLLLQAQAQNIALSLQLAQVERQEYRHRRLVALLQELTSDVPSYIDTENFYETFAERIRVAISGMLDTQVFALVVPRMYSVETLLAYYAVVDSGQRYAPFSLREDQVPWWQWVRHGRTLTRITDEERTAQPHLRVRNWGSGEYMDSQIFVPVKAPSGVVGALLVASARANAYTADQVMLLEMAGRFIGLAIEHAQMRNARKTAGNTSSDSERALAVLNNALLGLNATLEVETIVHDLVEQASELTRGQVCAYVEYVPQSDELVIRDIAQNKDHPHAELIGQRFPVGNGRRRLAVEGQSQSLEDLTTDYQRGDAIGALLERYNVRAMLLAPVIHKESVTRHDRVLGLLAVYSPDQRGLFSPAETMNLMALGHVAASALNNARTYAQLRELDRLKDEFILTASHEFRTPMSAIQGFSWLIQRRYESMTPEQAKHWAGEIMRATEQLKDMMDTLTESWRTKSVQLPPLVPVNIATTAQLAEEISSGLLAAENHIVQSNVPGDLWVLSDQDRLRHVISNLLVNAAKYSQPNAQITVTATVKSAAELLAQPRERGAPDDESDEAQVINVTPKSGPWVMVSVHDQGIGITAANQKRLFAKFVRLALTTSVRGTGLGLYICRRYIEAMGGEIWVESAPGKGSTFSFCLPQTSPGEAGG
jgi:signal transduction histidine kinase